MILDQASKRRFRDSLTITNQILPKNDDSTWKKVAKWALIIFSFGSVLIATFLIDLTKKAISRIFTKKNPSLFVLPTLRT